MRAHCLLLSLGTVLILNSDLAAQTKIHVYYDSAKKKPAGNVQVFVTTLGENDPKGIRPDGKTLSDGTYDAEKEQSLVESCTRVRKKVDDTTPCHVLLVTARSPGKSAAKRIYLSKKGWGPQPIELVLQELCPSRVEPPSSPQICGDWRAKCYWKITPLRVPVTRFVAETSINRGTVYRPVQEWKVVDVRLELVPASEVPRDANMSQGFPDWSVRFLQQPRCRCQDPPPHLPDSTPWSHPIPDPW